MAAMEPPAMVADASCMPWKGGQSPLPVTEGAPHVRFRELLVGGEVAA